MSTDPLTRELSQPTPGGCCSDPVAAPVVPPTIFNPPGLSALQYRIGTFSSFRDAMLQSVAAPDLLASAVTSLKSDVSASTSSVAVVDAGQFPVVPPFRVKIGTEYLTVIDGAGTADWKVSRDASAAAHATGDPVILVPVNPFASWQPGITGDYQTMFVELWAYLADILTFYQERIANEAFLPTATQRDSLLRLAALVDYHASPGSGASGLAAFTVAKNQSITVPGGFRVGSRPKPGIPAVVFETSAAIAASGDSSVIPLSPVSPDISFPTNTIVLKGVNSRLSPNDYVLAVEGEGTSSEAAFLLRLDAVNVDKTAKVTTLSWTEINRAYTQARKSVSLYAFRITAAPFGATAPVWNTLSPFLNNSDGKNRDAEYDSDWDTSFELVYDQTLLDGSLGLKVRALNASATTGQTFSGRETLVRDPNSRLLYRTDFEIYDFAEKVANPWYFIPSPPDPTSMVFLDSVYSDLKYSAESPGRIVLITDNAFQILKVTEARQVVKTGYAMTVKVTRLQCTESVAGMTYPLRDTTVFTGSEKQELQQDLPLPVQLSGSTLVLAGVHLQLQPGQIVILKGNLLDAATNTASPTLMSEPAVLDGPPAPDIPNDVTVVNLKKPLLNQYFRASCSIMANIVEITQGETVKDEILGSGDGSAFQSFVLKKKPVTYLPSTDPEGLSTVQSTLLVTVNGVEWIEQPNLMASAPHDQHYMVTRDDLGQSTVSFGDGFNGARPPSGVNNIHAAYRKGLGSSGNVSGGGVAQLIDNVPSLQKVTNPVSLNGGSDPESIGEIRTQAPSSLRTFCRAVSASDYAALALSYPGIAKASAALVLQDPVTQRSVLYPYIQLTVATSSQSPIQGTPLAGKLRQFLDGHRDPNILLRILDSTPVYIAVSVEVEIDSRFPHQGTLHEVQAALNPGLNPDGSAGYFAFQRLQFGQSIFLSEVYAVVQAVPGVLDANITELRRAISLTPDIIFRPLPGAGISLAGVRSFGSSLGGGLGSIRTNLPRLTPGFVVAPSTAPQDLTVGPTEIVTIDPVAASGSALTVTGQGGFVDT